MLCKIYYLVYIEVYCFFANLIQHSQSDLNVTPTFLNLIATLLKDMKKVIQVCHKIGGESAGTCVIQISNPVTVNYFDVTLL